MNGVVAVSWEEQSLSPLAALLDDPATNREAADEETTAPLMREIAELEAMSIFPGVPLS
jgi:hypothetical protein